MCGTAQKVGMSEGRIYNDSQNSSLILSCQNINVGVLLIYESLHVNENAYNCISGLNVDFR
jgi:hypothetical protein